MYCGKSREGKMNDDFTLVSRVVIKLTGIVENSLSHSFFFDSLFTSSALLALSVEEVLKQTEH